MPPYTDTSGPAFANAGAQNTDQKAALLAAIAQNGSNGQAALQAQAAQAQAMKAAAIQQINDATKGNSATVSTPSFAGQQAGLGAGVGDARAADIAQAQQAYGQNMDAMKASNASYFDKVGAAIPIVQARTQAAVQQIIGQQKAQAAAQAAALQQQQLQLQAQRESIAAQAQQRQFDLTNQGSQSNIAKSELGIKQAQATRDQFCFDNPGSPQCTGASGAAAQKALDVQNRQQAVLQQAYNSSHASDGSSKAHDALLGIVSHNGDLTSALADLANGYASKAAALKTKGGGLLDRQFLENYLRQYYSVI